MPEQEIPELKGKKVKKAVVEDDCLIVIFEDGSELSVAAMHGPGADGGWYTWTSVYLRSPDKPELKIINK